MTIRPAEVDLAQLAVPTIDEVRPTARTHAWFSVIWMIYLIDYADRFAISAVLPSIAQEFALDDAQLGLVSGSLFLGLALLAVPCGLAVDRYSRNDADQ
mgnify:CR=1 FL=1